MQYEVSTIINVKIGCIIFYIKDVLICGIFLLNGKNGHDYQEHSKDCAPCHFLINVYAHHELIVVSYDLCCFVCNKKNRATTILICIQCQRGWNKACLTLIFLFFFYKIGFIFIQKILLTIPHLLKKMKDSFFYICHIFLWSSSYNIGLIVYDFVEKAL